MKKTTICWIIFLALFLTLLLNPLNQQKTKAASSRLEFNDVNGNFYNYCPSYIEVNTNTRYIFYCKNPNSGKIVDSIYMRKATRSGSTWSWGKQKEVLKKGTGWESVHVCDPEVRQGSFKVGNKTYGWAMFYLGCDQLDNNHNQIGVAFADSIEGPWVKWSGNPLVPFDQTILISKMPGSKNKM